MKVLAPMAGITDAKFAIKLIPYGFDTVSIGGYNTDKETIAAGEKIIKRGRKEFNYPKEEIFEIIQKESNEIKNKFNNINLSANLRATNPEPLIEISKIANLDIIEINCHCRQEELQNISCGQAMLKRPDLEDFIKEVVKKSKSKVSVKMRANIEGNNDLEIAKLLENCKIDYLHLDAMKPGIANADFELISQIANETQLHIIGNNSVNSNEQAQKILNSGAKSFSIARAAIGGKLNFYI